MRSALDNILKLTCGHLCVFLGWSYRYTYVGTPLNFTWGHLWVLYSLEILSVLTVYTVYLADTLEFTRGHPIQRTTFSEGKKHTEELFGIFPSCSPPQQGKEEWPGPFCILYSSPFLFSHSFFLFYHYFLSFIFYLLCTRIALFNTFSFFPFFYNCKCGSD